MKYRVMIRSYVTVEIPKKAINAEFIKSFAEYMYPFDSVEEHAGHLGQLAARGLIPSNDFVEGYGDIAEMGIKVQLVEYEAPEVERVP